MLYTNIKDDESEQLKSVCENNYISEIGKLFLNSDLEEDEEVLALQDGGKVQVSNLNILQFAAHKKS